MASSGMTLRRSDSQTLESMDVLLLDSPQRPSFGGITFVDQQPQTTKLRREKEAFRRRKQRQRRKLERENLECEVCELSSQLERLKQAIESNAGTSRASIQLSNYYWRDCASVMSEERLRAEAEQKCLVVLTQAQATYIDNLLKMMQSQLNGDNYWELTTNQKRLPVEPSNDAVFSALLEEVDSCYARVDDVLRESRMDDMPVGITNSVHRRKVNGEVEYLQHVNKVMQPFDFESTSNFSWKVAGHSHRQQDREEYKGAKGLVNTIACKFRLVQTLTSGTRVSVLQRLVARRFVEDDRTIHVWKIYSEGEGILRGMHSDETGWGKIRPAVDGFSTWTEVLVRQVPVVFNAVDSSETIVNEFRRMLKDKVDDDERALTCALESLLLEDTLAILDV
ncbi:unnamed protein product [Phytophthora lilii]|uniref:Unnamed protein product n=1 Tax=Phytophthora lilii TaxID=2077276 RepID=A0A9W6X1K8_9STRA|nr:unnamed protein product [Phytophthora lilii]